MKQDNFFEMAAQITKAHAYDIVSAQVGELQEQNKVFRAALRQVLNEIATMNPAEVADKPAIFVGKISEICNDVLIKNRPL